ncbi:MAG: porin family protein [Cellvibrionaceae bacterium]|nr:porin family protein [Cellvibrionaceae bacterium]
MNRKTLSAALLAACTTPLSVFAAETISYNYIEAEYVVQDVDMYEDDDAFDNIIEDVDDGDGFKIGASFAFTNNLFIFGNYAQTQADFTFINDTATVIPADTDIKTLQLGLGYFAPINANTDFVVRAAYMDVDYDEFSLGQTDQDIGDDDTTFGDAWDDLNEDTSDGYFVDAGVRAQVIDWLELGGGIRYTDLDSGDDFSVFGNALFEINQNLGINLTASIGDNLSSYGLGVRYSM